jgi:DNA-binding MltR family transcriptional regulator
VRPVKVGGRANDKTKLTSFPIIGGSSRPRVAVDTLYRNIFRADVTATIGMWRRRHAVGRTSMSKKKNLLRELSKRVPTPPEVKKIMELLRGKDDIHVGIIAVSIIEATLERLLISRLHKSDKKFLDVLFQNRGPMSDLNSKILIGEAIGLLTTALAKELHVMRAIRNAFAHSKIPISFENAPVKKEVDTLKLVGHIRDSNLQFDPPLDHKRRFLLAIEIALIMMDVISKSKGTAAEVIEEALAQPTT